MKSIFVLIILVLTVAVMPSCAYKLSTNLESLPGDVRHIQIPLFKNSSPEPGAEIYFTNSLKSEALRSRVAKLENESGQAEAILQGTIISIETLAGDSVIESSANPYLASGTVLATQYALSVNIFLELKKKDSSLVLWSGNFKQSKNYTAAQITLPVINTSNSLYNQSAKRQTLDALSKEMMQAAFDRMLENF